MAIAGRKAGFKRRNCGSWSRRTPEWKIWELVVLVMAVGGASYIALRALGSRLGLALAGFVGGFISASATIGSMGNRAKRSPELGSAAASGAILATVGTVIQMFLVLLVTNVATCRGVAMPLLFAGVAAIGYALIFIALSSKTPTTNEPTAGRAFDLRLAFLFAMTITVILFLCAFLKQRYGNRGLFLGQPFRDLPIPTRRQFRSRRSFPRESLHRGQRFSPFCSVSQQIR